MLSVGEDVLLWDNFFIEKFLEEYFLDSISYVKELKFI